MPDKTSRIDARFNARKNGSQNVRIIDVKLINKVQGKMPEYI